MNLSSMQPVRSWLEAANLELIIKADAKMCASQSMHEVRTSPYFEQPILLDVHQ